MQIVGITGGIACGKSLVVALFGAWGARVASADDDARAVVAPGSPLLASVFAAFPGAQGHDGVLDRRRLAEIAFADADARAHLEAILHPAIFERMTQAISAARRETDAPMLAYEVPLLFEKNREGLFDATVAVVCSPETQAARLRERETKRGITLTPAQIAERLAAQLPNDEKARRADYVIRTDGVTSDTEAQTRAVWYQLTGSEPVAFRV